MRVTSPDGLVHHLPRIEAVLWNTTRYTTYTTCHQRVAASAQPTGQSVDCPKCLKGLQR